MIFQRMAAAACRFRPTARERVAERERLDRPDGNGRPHAPRSRGQTPPCRRLGTQAVHAGSAAPEHRAVPARRIRYVLERAASLSTPPRRRGLDTIIQRLGDRLFPAGADGEVAVASLTASRGRYLFITMDQLDNRP